MSLKLKFSGALLEARQEQNLTQAQVAAELGISVRWYQKIESGRKFPSGQLLLHLILYLNIDIEKLREECGFNVPVPAVSRDTVHK